MPYISNCNIIAILYTQSKGTLLLKVHKKYILQKHPLPPLPSISWPMRFSNKKRDTAINQIPFLLSGTPVELPDFIKNDVKSRNHGGRIRMRHRRTSLLLGSHPALLPAQK
jgi:hypothetical protein